VWTAVPPSGHLLNMAGKGVYGRSWHWWVGWRALLEPHRRLTLGEALMPRAVEAGSESPVPLVSRKSEDTEAKKDGFWFGLQSTVSSHTTATACEAAITNRSARAYTMPQRTLLGSMGLLRAFSPCAPGSPSNPQTCKLT
jgi:hypothetical protein